MFIQALLVAVEAHGNQKRRFTDKPYVMHPIRVADILSLHEDPEVLVHSKPAAVMHDVLEDTVNRHSKGTPDRRPKGTLLRVGF